MAYRLLGTRGPAEEVAQETLTRAFARWERMTGDATGWCVKVALNLAMDQLRSFDRQQRRQHQLIALNDGTTADPYAAERVDLYAALRRLPRRQREIVALRYIGDLSEQQTAVALGVSLGNVKSQSSRGLATLRGYLDPQHTTRSSNV
ncbi:SigE family RNA polymerase sigma factor [Acidothermaceae bacterium B102]|nr:SigE family RNA polymerase sigma factor [Acidothermaceae bacterium B102]